MSCFAALALICCAADPAEEWDLQLKAAVLYNFARFVEWPQTPNADSSFFTFCVVGSDPLYPVLALSLRGKLIHGKTVMARRIQSSDAQHCDMVFIGKTENANNAEILHAAPGFRALTVSDAKQFAARGGMVQLIKDGNRFRFTINLDAVSRSGLRLSSRLLQLAGRPPGGKS